uniref:Reverse transcriptase domain-containing protein n=1 Tax=Tanacetum cinerariifolium TaxID=118510 RepID=A0A699HT87_TANCI|nr:hypothetical protein [Tanacetum cinerariifolium]
MKKTRILTRLYVVTPTIVLRRNLFKARHVTQQDVYAVTLLIWKDELSESALRRNLSTSSDGLDHGFVGYPFDYRVTLGFGSIADGLDHVNHVIRLPLEHGISRVLGKDDYFNLSELSTLGASLKKPLSKSIVYHSRSLNELKTSTTSSRKAMNHYIKLGNGPIPGMTPTQALTKIQTMAGHSQKWNEGTSSRNISSTSDTDGLVAVISKLDNLGHDVKKLKENVHAIQVGCQICEGPHLDKECPLNEEVKQVDEVKYGEFGRPIPFNGSSKAKFRVGASISIMPFSMFKRLGIGKLEPINMVIEMADDTKCISKGIVKNLLIKIDKFIIPIDFFILDIIEDFRMPVILGRPLLATAYAKVDIFQKTISLKAGNEKRKRFGNEYDDNEEFEDPNRCGESKENEILGTVLKKLHDEWFKGTDEYDDDLKGIIDYLEPTLYDGFIDSDDEVYKEMKCRLLGMPYIKPTLILIEKVNVTRYSIGPGEVYTKIKVSGVEELSRTRGNITTIRAGIMDEISRNADNEESYDET